MVDVSTNPQMRPISALGSAHLDMLRGIAAMVVMGGHLRGLFYVDYSHVFTKNVLISAVYFVTSLGHQAVLVFFMLSGLLISRSVLNTFRKASWSWQVYLINRLTRLLVVLVPGLFLCVFWDRLGMGLAAGAAFYYSPVPAFGDSAIAARSSFGIFVGNLLFLQSVYFPSFGSDTPLWSLSYEFWYYVLFPILLLVFFSHQTRLRRSAYLVLGSVIVLMLGAGIALLFLVWLAGVGVGLLYDRSAKEVRRPLAALYTYGLAGSGAIALVVAKLTLQGGAVADLIVGAAFLPLIYLSVGASGAHVNCRYVKTAKLLASFSYSLYLTHLPLLVFIRSCMGKARWQPNLEHTAYGLGLACLAITYAFGISRLTEARTDVVRRGIVGRLAPSV